jgi:hypothetical protein
MHHEASVAVLSAVVFGLVLLGLPTRGADPIRITRSGHYEVPAPSQEARVTAVGYASLQRNVLLESIDCPEGALIRRSEDNGKTWITTETWKSTEPLAGDRSLFKGMPDVFLDPDNGRLLRLYYQHERIRGLAPWDPGAPDMLTTRIYTQVSKDEGRTWGPPEPVVQQGPGFDQVHWTDGVWHGKNGGVYEAYGPLKLKDGTILMPAVLYKLHDNGSVRPPDSWATLLSTCFLGRWRPDESGIDWERGQALELPRRYSNDGADEPSIAPLPDGRLFMIIRARVGEGPKTELPDLKYYSVSSDGGRTWSAGAPLLYDDGGLPYSPACLGKMVRSSKNGKLYLITNINAEPSERCDPRSTLQIGEIDPQTLRLLRASMTTVETRSGEQPPNIRFSNFRWYEDRETRDLVLFLTACPGDVGRSLTCGCPGSSYRYEIKLPDPEAGSAPTNAR